MLVYPVLLRSFRAARHVGPPGPPHTATKHDREEVQELAASAVAKADTERKCAIRWDAFVLLALQQLLDVLHSQSSSVFMIVFPAGSRNGPVVNGAERQCRPSA